MKAIKFFAAAAVVAALAVSCNSSNDPKVDVEMPTAAEVDSVSYLIGVNFGSFLKGNNFAENLNEINMAEVKKGMQAFLDAEGTPYDPDFGEQFKINPNDMGRILNGFITKKQAYKAAVNLAKGKEFLRYFLCGLQIICICQAVPQSFLHDLIVYHNHSIVDPIGVLMD